MPTSLLRKGLIVSIEEFISSIEKSGNIKINYKYNQISALPEDTSINIYRIIKEVVHNAIKHSKASEITIEISQNHNSLSIYCYDNGIGFNVEETMATSAGFGLRNLKSRAEVMQGTMTAESKPGKGTAFLFQIPINL
jgi:two-component system sensor histidine kinase DegS